MKKSKILIPALGILVLSTAASITGTVAWFSVNNSVTVDGMAVKTQVAGNLLIADENTESKFGSSLTQGRTGTLEPASTIDGVSYYYTTDAKADGSKEHNTTDKPYVLYNEDTALENTNAGKSNYDDDFVEAYTKLKNPTSGDPVVTTSNVVYGYIDYSFYLKATNTAASDYEIRMTKCNMLYKADGTNFSALGAKDLSWRVGVFSIGCEQGETTTAEVATGETQKSILKLSSGAYFEDGKAVSSTSAKNSVSKLGSAVKVAGDIAQNQTVYTKVTVRLWLEGEDKSCNNETYASLTKDWKLDLEFKFVDETDSVAGNAAVTAISSVA